QMTGRTLSALGLFAMTLVGNSADLLPAQGPFEEECARLAAQKGNDTARLHQLFEVDWAHTMQDSPESATWVGYPGQNDRWTDQSLAAIARRKREQHTRLKVVESIERKSLSPADQLNYDLFKKGVVDAIEGER